MSSLNQCQFIGNLGKDPQIRSTQSGDKVANFSLAVSEKWKDKNGERKEKTEWINVVVFGNLVSVVEGYLRKGMKVFISGKMQTRKWTDKDGTDRYTTEIVLQGFDSKLVMLDGKKDGAPVDEQPNGASGGFEDDIPFARYQDEVMA